MESKLNRVSAGAVVAVLDRIGVFGNGG